MTADISDVTALVTRLKTGPLRATLDLEDVALPGVWVRLVNLEESTAGGAYDWSVEIVCLTEEKNPARAYPGLVELHNKVADLVDVEGPARFVTVNLPEGATVPGLAIPYLLQGT